MAQVSTTVNPLVRLRQDMPRKRPRYVANLGFLDEADYKRQQQFAQSDLEATQLEHQLQQQLASLYASQQQLTLQLQQSQREAETEWSPLQFILDTNEVWLTDGQDLLDPATFRATFNDPTIDQNLTEALSEEDIKGGSFHPDLTMEESTAVELRTAVQAEVQENIYAQAARTSLENAEQYQHFVAYVKIMTAGLEEVNQLGTEFANRTQSSPVFGPATPYLAKLLQVLNSLNNDTAIAQRFQVFSQNANLVYPLKRQESQIRNITPPFDPWGQTILELTDTPNVYAAFGNDQISQKVTDETFSARLTSALYTVFLVKEYQSEQKLITNLVAALTQIGQDIAFLQQVQIDSNTISLIQQKQTHLRWGLKAAQNRLRLIIVITNRLPRLAGLIRETYTQQ